MGCSSSKPPTAAEAAAESPSAIDVAESPSAVDVPEKSDVATASPTSSQEAGELSSAEPPPDAAAQAEQQQEEEQQEAAQQQPAPESTTARDEVVAAEVPPEAPKLVATDETLQEAAPAEAPAPAAPQTPKPVERVQLQPGEAPRLIFRKPNVKCGEHWKQVPVREPPSLPDGAPVGAMGYYDDSTAFMDTDLNLMHVVLRDHGYERVHEPNAAWAVYWHSGLLRADELPALAHLQPHQRLNKFPNAGALTNKASLYESVARLGVQHGWAPFSFLPQTFILPDELEAYEATLAKEEASGKGDTWILKPSTMQRGVGIFLHRAKSSTNAWGALRGGSELLPKAVREHKGVACRYVHPPFLLAEGLKSDCRMYVLLTSVHPLVCYVYDEGLARFATEPYDISTCMSLIIGLNRIASRRVYTRAQTSMNRTRVDQ